MRNLKRLATVGLVVLGLGFNTSCESDDSNVCEVVQEVTFNGVWETTTTSSMDADGEYKGIIEWKFQEENLTVTLFDRLGLPKYIRTYTFEKVGDNLITTSEYDTQIIYEVTYFDGYTMELKREFTDGNEPFEFTLIKK